MQVKLLPNSFIFCEAADPYLCLYPTTPTRWASKIVQNAGIRNVSPQILRRSFVTALRQDGTDSKTVAALVGHSEAVEDKHYLGVAGEDRQRESIRRFADSIKTGNQEG